MDGTFIDRLHKDKIGLALAATENVYYAMTYSFANFKYGHLAKTREISNSSAEGQIAVVLRIRQPQARAVRHKDDEFYIFSHIPIDEIEGAYVGIPKEINTKTQGALDLDWYYLRTNRNSTKASISSITVSRVMKPANPYSDTAWENVLLQPKEIKAIPLDQIQAFFKQQKNLP